MAKRKVIGIGETVLDIIFKDNQPVAAKPGGSSFNALISLGRSNIATTFISDIGCDKVGDLIIDFLKQNNICSEFVNRHEACKTAIALAFLNQNSDAEYEFYKDYLNQNPHTQIPEINENDIVLFGSFYAINPQIRYILKNLLETAKKNNAIIYYDPNFRKSHLHELVELKQTILENMSYASIVRGSDEDFLNIFNTQNSNEIYKEVSKYCENVIITKNAAGVDVRTQEVTAHSPALPIQVVSTIGAGDSFNAGFIYALIKNNIGYSDLQGLNHEDWEKLVHTAIVFSTTVCQSYDNYVPENFNPLQVPV